jgi:enoyl-CoA hydratase/carnithine racemase
METSAAGGTGVGRSVEMEVEDGIAMIRLDQAERPVNVLSRDLVEELTAAIERLESADSGARAAVIISAKPGVWIAGADIDEFGRWRVPRTGSA